jgi:glutamate/tyrosine decarboxylase-like PLP-dependent enzyme
MDLHKYAFAAKGASTILYRSQELRRYQIYTCAQWTGYTIVNPTMQSTKSAGPLAAAWAVLHFIGDDGYLELARQMLDATRRVTAGIEQIEGLRLLGRPDMNLVAFTSDEMSVFHIIDEMKQRGWYIQPQLGFHGSKENVHLSINPAGAKWVGDFLRDLRECTQIARTMKTEQLSAAVRAALANVKPGTLSSEMFGDMLRMAGVDGTALPERMAGINELLNSLPAELTEEVLTEYVNRLFHHQAK